MMWIKTQDGALLNLDTVHSIAREERKVWAFEDWTGARGDVIGLYDSEDAAKEVMGELEEALAGRTPPADGKAKDSNEKWPLSKTLRMCDNGEFVEEARDEQGDVDAKGNAAEVQ